MSMIMRLVRFVLRLPARTVVGKDLQGNKFIEISRGPGILPKRIVKYAGPKRYLSDYSSNKDLPPQWAAWLSYTRGPPSLDELRVDQARYARIQQIVRSKNQTMIDSPESNRQHASRVMNETPLTAFLPSQFKANIKPTSSNQSGDNGWQPDTAQIKPAGRRGTKSTS